MLGEITAQIFGNEGRPLRKASFCFGLGDPTTIQDFGIQNLEGVCHAQGVGADPILTHPAD
jgi:hypothetical protein